MQIQHFFDPRTCTLTYVVVLGGDAAVVIDSVMDYDPKSGRVWYESAERIASWLDERGLGVPFVLDTHVHADHLSAMQFFKERYGAKTVIGAGVTHVQETMRDVFNLGTAFPVDGSQWDVLLEDGATLEVGGHVIEAIPTGGHTPASVSYRIGDAVFVGDSIFMPDQGTARCDFPGGSAEELYDSIQRLFALPDATRIFTAHDYQPGGRELRFECPVAEERRDNIHAGSGVTKQEFVARRKELEKDKPMPTLLLPAVQVNMRAGCLPEPEANDRSYLKIPINAF